MAWDRPQVQPDPGTRVNCGCHASLGDTTTRRLESAGDRLGAAPTARRVEPSKHRVYGPMRRRAAVARKTEPRGGGTRQSSWRRAGQGKRGGVEKSVKGQGFLGPDWLCLAQV